VATKTKVGIIGTGNISPAYINGCRAWEILDLVAVADIDAEKARSVGEKFEIEVRTIDELLKDPEIGIIINLTIPAVHADVSLQVIDAGKSVHSEKPLAVTREDGRRILDAAQAKGVRVGCAPDTFLFGAHQTCRKLIDDGAIGEAVAAVAFMASHGPEKWHPNPGFFYETGGGPMFDMGPYYITCLVALLGPVRRVSALTRASFPERIAGDGRRLPVSVPTHYAGSLEFVSGPIASVITSFDIWGHHLPMMEVYGSAGTLRVPDPNGWEFFVHMQPEGVAEWQDIPLTHSADWRRGIGVADMAYAIQSGRPHRASGDLAYHVLDVMHAFEDSSNTGQTIAIESTVERPAAVPVGLEARHLDP